MKKINIILSGALLATAFAFISTASAQAGECSAEDPCGTWAVVNDSGVVSNIIVCQPSVCGSGTFAGMKVVFQVPANSTNHTSQGGYYHSEPEQVVTYNEQTNRFSMGSNSNPVLVTRTEVVDSVTLSATIRSTTVTFGPDNFINGKMEFTPIVDTSTGATISATKITGNATTIERLTFATPQTVEQIRVSLTEELVMLRTNLNRLIVLLKNWVKN
jgi:hypothetical protein